MVEGGWVPTFWSFKSLYINMVYTLGVYVYIFSYSHKCRFVKISYTFVFIYYYARIYGLYISIECLVKKKRRSAPGPLGDFFIVSFKNSVSFYFVKKIRKLPSILYDNCL